MIDRVPISKLITLINPNSVSRKSLENLVNSFCRKVPNINRGDIEELNSGKIKYSEFRRRAVDRTNHSPHCSKVYGGRTEGKNVDGLKNT